MNTESAEENTEEEIETENETTDDDQESTQEQQNPLALSDDEIMAMDAPADIASKPASTDEPANESSDETQTPDDAVDDAESKEPEPKEPAKQADPEDSDGKEPERDIAAEHARLFAPLKAGGQTLELKSVDEIISLMQKGADYHRKTEELSAHRKTIKTLEKAGIKPDNLNYLIDLHNKDPQAIAKLLADSKIDPFEIDTDSEETKNYKPKEHALSDGDLALDETLAELKQTSTYQDLIEVVGNKWDDQSRQIVANNTDLLKVINTHMADGIYPLIAAEVTRQKTFGNFQGLTDLAAYQQVGEAMDAQGAFTHLITDERRAQWAQQHKPAQAPVSYRPKQGSSDPNLDAKRRAASPTKAASRVQKKTSTQGNPLALSDAEFEKQFSSTLQ